MNQLTVDRQTTNLQLNGWINTGGMTLAEICQCVANLGLDPFRIGFSGGSLAIVTEAELARADGTGLLGATVIRGLAP